MAMAGGLLTRNRQRAIAVLRYGLRSFGDLEGRLGVGAAAAMAARHREKVDLS